MPRRLRPTAPTASDAVLVGDPGRALLLAQELLEQPKMSNHARGLWGYYGQTSAGKPLTIQSTGMGGPSAALVLGDLAALGVRRVVRVGTCVAMDPAHEPGDLLLVAEAIASGGSATSLGLKADASVWPSQALSELLERQLGSASRPATVTSLDAHPGDMTTSTGGAADMQTAAILARADTLRIEAAALLIVVEDVGHAKQLKQEELEELERRAGRVAGAALST
jgi:uridine phosphorylase